MKLIWMIIILFCYLCLTGFISAKITGGGYEALIVWLIFIFIWNNIIAKILPPVNDNP